MAVATNAGALYPVNINVEPQTAPRNKLTVGFRIILAIPHALLVGGVFGAGALFAYRGGDEGFAATGAVPRFWAELDARGIAADPSVFKT